MGITVARLDWRSIDLRRIGRIGGLIASGNRSYPTIRKRGNTAKSKAHHKELLGRSGNTAFKYCTQ